MTLQEEDALLKEMTGGCQVGDLDSFSSNIEFTIAGIMEFRRNSDHDDCQNENLINFS